MTLRHFLVAALCSFGLCAAVAPAQIEDSSTIDQCSQYNGYPSYCQNTAGCVYDYNYGNCYLQNPGPTPNQCSQYNYDPRTCNSVYGCQYDYRFNSCVATGPVPPPTPPPPSRRGWCAGGVRVPSYVLRDENEAYACARQIAAGGVDCARFATYGVCDTAGYGPGYSSDPSSGWCRCNSRPARPSPLRWDGPTYRP